MIGILMNYKLHRVSITISSNYQDINILHFNMVDE